MPFSSAMMVAYTAQFTTSPKRDWLWRYTGASGSLEIGVAGKITHSWSSGCCFALRPASAEPSAVTTSHDPWMKLSVMASKSSRVVRVMSIPAASAASETFCSVVVPARAHTTAPAMSATPEDGEKSSPARAMSCWPS